MGSGHSYLLLRATFLVGTYGGEEWPPAPFRLIQAIVAGCRGIDSPGLAWLARQEPPFVLASAEPEVVQFKRAIPNNADPRKPQALLSMRGVSVRRVDTPVCYVWPLRSDDDRQQASSLTASAEQVHTLGTGEDMCTVRAEIVAEAPQSVAGLLLWIPAAGAARDVLKDGDVSLRVPVEGSLGSIEERFQAFQLRLNAGTAGYARPVLAPALHRTARYRTSDHTPRQAMVVMRLQQAHGRGDFRRFHAEDAVVVAGLLRHAAMRVACSIGGDPALADFAAGHPPEGRLDERMSWVPLPSVGHTHADGLIRRGLWLCRAVDQDRLQQLVQALPAAGIPLTDEGTGESIAMAEAVSPGSEPVLVHYMGPSKEWVSITPVVLPGDYGAGNIRLMTRLLHKATRESGIDPGLLESVEFSKTGFSRQSTRIRDVRLKDWSAKNLILYHVRVRFSAPLHGPMVFGRGRHYGLGLLCANLE